MSGEAEAILRRRKGKMGFCGVGVVPVSNHEKGESREAGTGRN